MYETRSKESAEATHKPQINNRSKQLVAGKRYEDVSEYLYSLAPAQRMHMENMKEEKFYEEVPGNPAITRMAAQLQREGPIGDRLYNSAVEQQQRHRERVERAELEKIERAKAAAAFHSNTQRDLRNLASRGGGRGNIDNQNDGGNSAPQGHSLYNRAQQVLKKKDKLRQLESKAKEAQARPRLSKRSLRIANKLEKPSERLTKHTKQQMRELQMLSIKREINDYERNNVGARQQSHHNKKGHLPSDILDPELTFQPQVNKISERIAKTKNAVKNLQKGERKIDFGERLHRDHKTWHKDLHRLRKEKEDKELAECTFQPNRSKSKRTYQKMGMGNGTTNSNRMNNNMMNDAPEYRLNKWLRKRDQKIERKIKERNDGYLKGCTFEPNVDRRQSRVRKKKAGSGAPENSKHRVAWNKERRASQRFSMVQKIAENDYNIISSPYISNEMSYEDDDDVENSNVVEQDRMNRQYNNNRTPPRSRNGNKPPETPEQARERRRQESEKKHMLRMRKAHANRRHQRASNIRNQLRDPYSVSGNTNPDWKAIGAGGFAFKSFEAKETAKDAERKRIAMHNNYIQQNNNKKDKYSHVIKPPVSAGEYLDLHETF